MIIDFHIHSKYSFDCFLEPSVIVKMARRRGIAGLAVVDHDTMAGIDEFRSLAPDLFIIAGQEVSTTSGDILGLFLKDEIQPHKNVSDCIQEIRSQGALAILAHPFKWPHFFREPDLLKKFDAIEVFNARNNIPLPYLENFLAKRAVKKLNLNFVAGSDAHEPFAVGQAGCVFDFSLNDASEEKIKRAILKRDLKVVGKEIFLPVEIFSHFSRNRVKKSQ